MVYKQSTVLTIAKCQIGIWYWRKIFPNFCFFELRILTHFRGIWTIWTFHPESSSHFYKYVESNWMQQNGWLLNRMGRPVVVGRKQSNICTEIMYDLYFENVNSIDERAVYMKRSVQYWLNPHGLSINYRILESVITVNEVRLIKN